MDPYLKAQLERDEGRKLEAYKDTATVPVWTIGVGHALNTGTEPRVKKITDRECDAWFEMDVAQAVDDLVAVFGGAIMRVDQARWRALVNMAFNRGQTNMQKSTTITPAIMEAMRAPDAASAGVRWQQVSNAILASPWCAQIKDRGKRIARQLSTGQDQ